MKIHLTMDFEIDSKEVDGGSDIDWAVFNAVRNHANQARHLDEFFAPEDSSILFVDYTEEE